ncbi:MAG: ABC transporter permease, partial [Anaerolineales bacterium]|nr:ABC transporter permease [Anaerolineales bacterium]
MNSIRRALRPEQIREFILVLLIFAAILFFGSQIENYYQPRTFTRIASSVAILVVVAVGQTLVVLMRNIDLSVGSIVGFTAYFVGRAIVNNPDLSPLTIVLLSILLGGILGLVNGVIIAYGRVPAIITTLGTLAIYRSLLVQFSDAQTIITSALPEWLVNLPQVNAFVIGEELEVKLIVLVALIIVVIFQLVVTYLPWGRRLYAIGSNPDAAAMSGLPVTRM